MKTRIKPIVSTILFLCINGNLNAQAFWTYALNYKLGGNIKTYAIVDASGEIVFKEEFKTKADQIAFMQREDSIRNAGRINPVVLSAEYERIYPLNIPAYDSTMKFNRRGQLIERQVGNTHEWNTFTEDGKIVCHIRTETFSETIVGGGVKTRNPKKTMADYVFSYSISTIVIFKYNSFGSLLEFEYYTSDPKKNIRIANNYDENNNLLESDRFNSENISWKLLKEDYLEKFIHTDIDQYFSIDNYYPDYWCEGTPLKETWKYNSHNQKIRYVLYDGYLHSPGFEAKWVYNTNGVLIEERHYEISPNELKRIIVFDSFGNAILETEYTEFPHQMISWSYLIEYY